MRLAAVGLVAVIAASVGFGAFGAGSSFSSGSNRAFRTGLTTLGSRPLRPDQAPAARATADHPLFRSSYIGEPDRVIAETSFGKVTAQDLYLWLLLRDGPNKPYLLHALDRARTEAERQSLATLVKGEINDYVFTNFIVPKLAPTAPCHPIDKLKAYYYSLPGYQLAYILDIIKPQVCLLPADRVKFMQEHKSEVTPPDRWRVRYIFRSANFDAPLEEQDQIETDLNALREKILGGEISFADAARQNSEAPSAANGGEIPPFRRGELFFMFEDAAMNLKPGELSGVFRGPGGFYMLQLLEVMCSQKPTLANPETAALVEEGLQVQVLKAQYEWDTQRLFERRRPVLRNVPWDTRTEEELVGDVCEFKITKREFWDLFPAIETDDLKRRDDLIGSYLKNLLEREAMAQEVRAKGFENNPLLVRSKQIAANLLKRDNLIESIQQKLTINEKIARAFWSENPKLFTPLAMKRLVKLTLTPVNTAPDPALTLTEMQRVMGQIASGQSPTPAGSVPWQEIQDLATTETLGGGPSLAPVTGGELKPLAEESVSSDTQTSKPLAEEKPLVLDALPPVQPSAPAAPAPAPAQVAAPAGAPAPAQPAGPPPALSAEGPKPAGTPLPKLPPGPYEPPVMGDVPVFRQPKVPPLPLDTFKHIEPTAVRDYVTAYPATDFSLAFRDLGYVYPTDVPGVPVIANDVEVGGYTPPALVGTAAESYFVEDAKRLPKPTFECVKARVYAIYRKVEVDKKVQEAYRKGVKEASILYSF